MVFVWMDRFDPIQTNESELISVFKTCIQIIQTKLRSNPNQSNYNLVGSVFAIRSVFVKTNPEIQISEPYNLIQIIQLDNSLLLKKTFKKTPIENALNALRESTDQPVSQEANGAHSLPQSFALQKYSPPAVGPTNIVNRPAISHPYTIVTGPPNARPVLYNVVIPVNTEMMEKNPETDYTSNLAMRFIKPQDSASSNLKTDISVNEYRMT
ncbi:hypothetical protein LXL04_025019 [Taraxacum kok-saghyz]